MMYSNRLAINSKLNSRIATTLFAVVVMLLFCNCSHQKKQTTQFTPRDSLSSMTTMKVNTLISDSGITRYRIKAKEWKVYDRKKPPHWAFEKGLHLEKFDTLFNIEASMDADTAYYYTKKRLWHLIGNIYVINQKKEEFRTQELFWNENTRKIYSDKYIQIDQIDQTITGYGFESNQNLTKYSIKNSGGKFSFNTTTRRDSTENNKPSDSLLNIKNNQ